jgi:hypothetical protein
MKSNRSNLLFIFSSYACPTITPTRNNHVHIALILTTCYCAGPAYEVRTEYNSYIHTLLIKIPVCTRILSTNCFVYILNAIIFYFQKHTTISKIEWNPSTTIPLSQTMESNFPIVSDHFLHSGHCSCRPANVLNFTILLTYSIIIDKK